ncbi:MAG: co-chaperone HscB [Plesiomonas sp.]|uniref:co-chaperone HscB n=1 Tax=Plesiomonas sp. TaxID=2486279 RepID=UPI003EE7BDAF
MNYFELFGLPVCFKVDGSLLTSHYRELQKQNHPDKFATASERDRLLAVQNAANINEGYQTLRDPLLRAEYLLAQNGVSLHAEQQTLRDPEFLMQQMMLREELEEIEQASSADIETLLGEFEQRLTVMNRTRMQQLQDDLEKAQWDQAADHVRKLKFLAKLRQEIERLEDNLLG